MADHLIKINYKKIPKGIVGGNPKIRKGTTFAFASDEGPLEVQFMGASPTDGLADAKLSDNTDFTAKNIGKFKFQCFLNGQLLPDSGGELEVGP